MMNDVTNMMGGTGWGMALITLLVICALVLGIVALIKYLSR
jgi:hypothetical protein